MSFADFTLEPLHKNEKFAWTGALSDLEKQSIPPYAFKKDRALLKRHRAELKGRLSRWKNLTDNMHIITYLIIVDILVYLRLGYPFTFVFKLWVQVQPHTELQDVIQVALKLIYKACPDLVKAQDPSPPSQDTLYSRCCVKAQEHVRLASSFAPSCTSSFPTPCSSTAAMGGSPWGGKGSWGGKGRGGRGPFQPRQGGGGDGLMGFANQFNDMMGSLASFGQMAQLGSALATAQAKQTSSTCGAGNGPTSPPQSSTLQTHELASALTTMLQGPTSAGPTGNGDGSSQQRGADGDSRLKNTVRRLAEFVNNGEPAGPAGAIEDQPAFKRLRAEMEALSKRTGTLEESVLAVNKTADETNQGVKQLMAMMQRKDPWLAGRGGKGNPGGKGGGEAPSQPAANVDGCAFQKTMTAELHTEALGLIGVGASRREAKALAETLPMEFKPWWEAVAPLKGTMQWRKKLESLGADEEQYKEANTEAVGNLLFRYLADDGTWSDTPLQDSPP